MLRLDLYFKSGDAYLFFGAACNFAKRVGEP